MSIRRPMKAPSDPITNDKLHLLKYPIVGSPKLDGFRCVVDGEPKTSSMKTWPNLFIRDYLTDAKFQGLDGEIVVGEPNDLNAFHNTSGPVRRYSGEPDFRLFVFDDWTHGDLTYKERWITTVKPRDKRIVVLEQRLLISPQDVIDYENEMLELGYEGAIIRSLKGRYKDNRCSFKDLNLFKRKPFVECEAEIIDVIEGRSNQNEPKMNEAGQMRRSFNKENMIPNGTFGSFKLKAKEWLLPFTSGLGEGSSDHMKQDIWDHKEEYIGMIVTVKYQKYGSRDRPRIPSVKIRPEWDRSVD